MTFVHKVAQRLAVAALVSGAAAALCCDGATGPNGPVASVAVTPVSASIQVGQTAQFTAVAKDSAGAVLHGRAVSWSSSNTLMATVTSEGLVTGHTGGSATITATSEGQNGTAAITVTARPLCVDQTGPTITVSGAQTSFDNTNMASATKVDASTAQFFPAGATVVAHVGGASGICWHGGEILGDLPPSTPWATMHDSYGIDVDGASFQLEHLRIFDTGDGVTMDSQGDVTWLWRDVYFKYMRDDCVENDFLNSGTIENSFFDGCYSGFSSRSYTSALDGSNNVVVLRNTLFRVQAMDQGYRRPGHGGFWKWESKAPRIDLYNTVFLTDGPTIEDDAILPPPGKLRNCSGNVMIWLGSGAFPEPLPSQPGCFTLLTGAAGQQYWDSAVAAWEAAHPNLLTDIAPPIVSLWSPTGDTTLTGNATLTATAVDDRDVVGVQFKLDGQDIGVEVTQESPTARFTLSWDSSGKPNGTYTLTATARDAAGHTTTSSGILVTISN
jgi:hypothetical protein